MSRFDRQESFFGKAGQEKLRHASVAIVGVGGLGTHVAQQLALLGIGKLALIDHEELSETNRNRYVSARHDDPIPGSPKVLLGERMVKAFNPDVIVETVPYELCSPQAFEAVNASDFVMGCLDSAGPRLVLTELCAAYSRPYFDLATEIHPGEPLVYGGHLCFSNGEGCLVCLEELDVAEAQRDLATPEAQAERRRIYGVEHQDLAESGPSVVSLNGVVASLGVTELLLELVGIRKARAFLRYRADLATVTARRDPPRHGCYYCGVVRGQRAGAGVERYVRSGSRAERDWPAT